MNTVLPFALAIMLGSLGADLVRLLIPALIRGIVAIERAWWRTS